MNYFFETFVLVNVKIDQVSLWYKAHQYNFIITCKSQSLVSNKHNKECKHVKKYM